MALRSSPSESRGRCDATTSLMRADSVRGRVRMIDIVHYDVGFGPLGRLMNKVYVASRLDDIFDYRASIIHDIFPQNRSAPSADEAAKTPPRAGAYA